MMPTTFSSRPATILAVVILLMTAAPGLAQVRPNNLSSGYFGSQQPSNLSSGYFGGQQPSNLSSGYYGGLQPAQPQYHRTYSNYGWTHYYNYYPHYGEYRYGYPYYSYNYGYPLNSTYGYSGSDALVGEADSYGASSYRSYYSSPARLSNRAPRPPDTTARITVRVPANAEVWFDETKTTSTGSDREYQTPALQLGHQYAYQVRARWMENGREVTQTQKVSVTAGSRPDVTFPLPVETKGQEEKPNTP
jgi:uncharacterized protein (TIGR03000 family)